MNSSGVGKMNIVGQGFISANPLIFNLRKQRLCATIILENITEEKQGARENESEAATEEASLSSWLLLGIKHHWLLDFSYPWPTKRLQTHLYLRIGLPDRRKEHYLPSLKGQRITQHRGNSPKLPGCAHVLLSKSHAHLTRFHIHRKTEFCVDLCIPWMDRNSCPLSAGALWGPLASEEVFLTHPWRGVLLHLLPDHIIFLQDSHC